MKNLVRKGLEIEGVELPIYVNFNLEAVVFQEYLSLLRKLNPKLLMIPAQIVDFTLENLNFPLFLEIFEEV